MAGKLEISLLAALVLAVLLSLGLVAAPGAGNVPAHDDGLTAAGLAWNN